MTRSIISSPAPDVFPISLFVYLFIFIRLPRRRHRRRCHRLPLEKTLRLRRDCLPRSTTLAKKNETGTQAKHRRVHARQITRLCHVRAVVSIFLARVVGTSAVKHPGFFLDFCTAILSYLESDRN